MMAEWNYYKISRNGKIICNYLLRPSITKEQTIEVSSLLLNKSDLNLMTVIQSISLRLRKQPAKEVARLSRKWKNKSFRYTKLKNADKAREPFGSFVLGLRVLVSYYCRTSISKIQLETLRISFSDTNTSLQNSVLRNHLTTLFPKIEWFCFSENLGK